jgi:hypothetical protein
VRGLAGDAAVASPSGKFPSDQIMHQQALLVRQFSLRRVQYAKNSNAQIAPKFVWEN